MLTPSSAELQDRPFLVPLDEIAEHLSMAIKGTAQFQRAATVTLTYKVSWNEEQEKLHVHSAVKSKRPVRPKRNEEVMEDDHHVLSLIHETPGQQRIDDPVADLVRVTKEHGVQVSIITGGRKVTIGKDAAAGK